MARRGENIHKRKDGLWEGRYIKARTDVYKRQDEMLSGIEPQRETKTQQAKDLICTLLAGGKQVLSEDIDKAALERGCLLYTSSTSDIERNEPFYIVAGSE